jgi:hypothetical protein
LVVATLIVNSLHNPDAQARESSRAATHPSLARRACMSLLLAFRKLTIKAVVAAVKRFPD